MTLALEIQGLRKTYPNGFEALQGIDLRVRQGDFFALLGANGAGKSTTIGIVTSLVNKSAGTVRVFDADLDGDPGAVKRNLGLVPQEFNFNVFETVWQIVTHQAGYYGVGRRLTRARAETYLRQLGLWDKRHERARNLSGGMKRRLMIARALLHEPRLLILDEPTAGVDIEIRRSMWAFLREINRRGTTIILTTHYLEEAESLCRHIAIIDQGRIIADTSMRALLEQLHCETFVLDLADALTGVPVVDGYPLQRVDERTLEVEVCKGQGINRLFAGLAQRGVEVVSLRNKTNRLEELFMGLVDKGPAAGQQPAGADRGGPGQR